MAMKMTVLQGGMLTTLQDNGRWGYQGSGFPVSGCMDRQAFQKANALVNNLLGEAVLEMQYLGGSFRFPCETYFALTGADMMPMLNGKRIEGYRAIKVKKGDVLECGRAVNGRFSYLAVAGGFHVPKVLGSASTNLKCRLGGFQGRALKAGDEIPLRRETVWLLNEYRKETTPESYDREVCLRVTSGPQEEMFTEEGLSDFYHAVYTLTEESDRMGYRLNGTAVKSRKGVDILSDGIVEGSVQIPKNGMPMILLADRQTTGGYAKIATVVRADLPKLVQCMPGAKIRFEKVSVEQAVKLYRKAERERKNYCKKVGYCPDNTGFLERLLKQRKREDIQRM
ncbi:MAG: biotin-dependent carboxyltransferase family protein [Lachnospiraceae bacterium]